MTRRAKNISFLIVVVVVISVWIATVLVTMNGILKDFPAQDQSFEESRLAAQAAKPWKYAGKLLTCISLCITGMATLLLTIIVIIPTKIQYGEYE